MPSDDDNDDVDDGIASKRRRTVRPSILMKLNSLTESNGLTVTKDDQVNTNLSLPILINIHK